MYNKIYKNLLFLPKLLIINEKETLFQYCLSEWLTVENTSTSQPNPSGVDCSQGKGNVTKFFKTVVENIILSMIIFIMNMKESVQG